MSSDAVIGEKVEPPDEATLRAMPVPTKAHSLEEVHTVYPALRQSLAASFDDCSLSTYFDLKYAQGWSTHPQARGTIFHRFAAEAMRTMRAEREETLPVSEALQILYETIRQRGVPPEDFVRVPLREIRDLRMAAVKFAADNAWDIGHVRSVEERLAATIYYPHPETGEPVQRVLTGQLDCLMADPKVRNGAIVLDWKETWAVPPEARSGKDPEEDDPEDGKRVSYHGYFQQRFYAYLVMVNFPLVQKVTLREFYVRKSTPRRAGVHRSRLHHIAQELSTLVELFDRTMAWGPPPYHGKGDAEGLLGYDLSTIGPWSPSPGKHCAYCTRPGQCPIEDEARREGAVTTHETARRYAAERRVAQRIVTDRTEALKPWVDLHGPVEEKAAKGRSVVGWVDNKTGNGRTFKSYVPDASDRSRTDADRHLEEAMRDAAAEQKAARRRRPPRRKKAKA